MKIYTVDDIRKLEPCYDPTDVVPEDTEGTLLDILKLENVKAEDKIWVVTHYLTDKQNRFFAVWCAREALKLTDNPDQRSINACDVTEKFALGKASKEELSAARAAALDAALDAAWSAAWSAAWYAARAAALDAAGAARATALDAAARDAAAWADAACADAWGAQLEKLIEALKSGEWD